MSLEERQAAEASFHHGTNVCIACTSTLELGIDVGDLDAVFQADAPSTVSSFLQRMGRTGRRTGTVANMTFKALREKREELGELLGRSARPVQVEAGKAFWWTFAGGRINYTLKYALEVIGRSARPWRNVCWTRSSAPYWMTTSESHPPTGGSKKFLPCYVNIPDSTMASII